MNSKKLLLALAVKYDGDWFEIYDFIVRKDFLDEKEIDDLCSRIKSKTITILDDEYPEYLKRCYRPPFVLFYKGDISLIQDNSHSLGVVGTREPTFPYDKLAYDIVYKLKKDLTIVSGLAKGIDAIAHTAALDSHKKTVAIIGCGLDVVYPLENRPIYQKVMQKGLVLSEYPDGSSPDAKHFPMRNRLVAFLSRSVFVPQANKRSGTSITVGYALEMGKNVYCLPSINFGNSACNIMIKDGAYLVESEKDIDEFFM